MTDTAIPRPRLLPALALGLAVLLGTTGLVPSAGPAWAQEMTDVDTPRARDADRRHAERPRRQPDEHEHVPAGRDDQPGLPPARLGAALRHRHRQGRADPRPRRGDARGARRQLHQVPRQAARGPDLVGRPALHRRRRRLHRRDDPRHHGLRLQRRLHQRHRLGDQGRRPHRRDHHHPADAAALDRARLGDLRQPLPRGAQAHLGEGGSGDLHQLPAGDDQRLQVQGRRPQRHLVPLGEARRLAELRRRPDGRRAASPTTCSSAPTAPRSAGCWRWPPTTWTS